MSNEAEPVSKRELREAMDTVEDANIFEDLVPDAKRVIRRVLLTSKDKKLSVSVAQDIMKSAGKVANSPITVAQTQINITDSDVKLLMAAIGEVKDDL